MATLSSTHRPHLMSLPGAQNDAAERASQASYRRWRTGPVSLDGMFPSSEPAVVEFTPKPIAHTPGLIGSLRTSVAMTVASLAIGIGQFVVGENALAVGFLLLAVVGVMTTSFLRGVSKRRSA